MQLRVLAAREEGGNHRTLWREADGGGADIPLSFAKEKVAAAVQKPTLFRFDINGGWCSAACLNEAAAAGSC